jgi:POT family proton-dependent oligopeptide transporter
LSSAYAFQIVGFISKQLAIESTDVNVGGLQTLAIYTDGFGLIAKYALGAGLVVRADWRRAARPGKGGGPALSAG